MNLRSSSDFVSLASSRNSSKKTKFIEILGTVAVTVVTATATIYGHHLAIKEKQIETNQQNALDTKKIDLEYYRIILQTQSDRILILEKQLEDSDNKVDLWHDKYYKVLEECNSLREDFIKLQKNFDEFIKKEKK